VRYYVTPYSKQVFAAHKRVNWNKGVPILETKTRATTRDCPYQKIDIVGAILYGCPD